MAYNPLDFFQAGQTVGKSKNAGFTAGTNTVMDAFKAQGERRGKLNDAIALEEAKGKVKGNQSTGVFSFNPLTGNLEQVSQVPKGSIVRNTLGEEDLRTKAMITQESQVEGKTIEAGGKLGTAVKRLKVINDQMNAALPAQGTNPFAQRILGPAAVLGAKTGIAPNPRLMALKKNIRPVGIQLIRAFGEVGNLSETEQKSAIDTVENENLNEEERMAALRQFAEFALAGARPEAIQYMIKDPSVSQIMQDFGISYGQETGRADGAPDGSNTSNLLPVEQARAAIMRKIAKDPSKKSAYMARFKEKYPGENLNG